MEGYIGKQKLAAKEEWIGWKSVQGGRQNCQHKYIIYSSIHPKGKILKTENVPKFTLNM